MSVEIFLDTGDKETNVTIKHTKHNGESFPDIIERKFSMDLDNPKALGQQLTNILAGMNING